jgi:hypothetical protein
MAFSNSPSTSTFALNKGFFLRHEFNILKRRFKTFNSQSMDEIPTVSDYKLNIQDLLSQCLKEKEFEGKSELVLEMSAFQIKLKKDFIHRDSR